jgi:hypothetical protein
MSEQFQLGDPRLTALIQQRLAGEASASLVRAALDYALERPVEELVDVPWLARQAVVTLESLTRDDATQRWIQKGLRELQQRVPPGRLGDQVPLEVSGPLRQVLARRILFDRALVGRLLDHEAARHLVTDLLQGALEGFVQRLRPVSNAVSNTVSNTVARSKGLSRLKLLGEGVKGLGDSVLGGISQELEHRAEHKVKEFVEGALHAAMEQVADHLCDPAHADRYASWRVHALNTLLQTENRVLVREIEKLDPEWLVEVGAGVARSVARRKELEAELTRAFEAALKGMKGRSLASFLEESGMQRGNGVDAWREQLESQLLGQTRNFMATPEFERWLSGLLAPEPSPTND